MKTSRLLWFMHLVPTLTPMLNLIFMFGLAHGYIHVAFPLAVFLWPASWTGGAWIINTLAQRLAEPLRRNHRTYALVALSLPMGMPLLLTFYNWWVPLDRSGGHAPIGEALNRLGLGFMLESVCLIAAFVMGVWGVIQLIRQRPCWTLPVKP